MIEVTKYIAFDGKEFDDEQECVDYETTNLSYWKDVIVLDGNGNRLIEKPLDIDSIKDAIFYCTIMCIPESVDANGFYTLMTGAFGLSVPKGNGWFKYDYYESEWISIEEKIKEASALQEIIDKYSV